MDAISFTSWDIILLIPEFRVRLMKIEQFLNEPDKMVDSLIDFFNEVEETCYLN